MRGIERVSGLLAGLLGIAALVFALTQHTVRIYTGTAVDSASTRNVILSVALAVVASLAVALSAMQDTRSLARGGWRWPLMVGAALCIGGICLLILNDMWVEVGMIPATSSISAGLLFVPAALATIICALAALRPRTQVARV